MLRTLRGAGVGRRSFSRLAAIGAVLASVGLAGFALTLGSGQAVGPVLSGDPGSSSGGRQVGTGSVTGSGGVTVTQGLVVDPDKAPEIVGADDAVAIAHDNGTSFTAALELDAGQRAAICVYLQNNSDATINATLELTVSAGLDVEVEEFSSTSNTAVNCSLTSMTNNGIVQEAQLARGRWLMKVGGGTTASTGAGVDNNDGIRVIVEPQDDIRPGFYTLSAKLAQVAG